VTNYKYLSPKEKYATMLYGAICEKGQTTKWDCGLSNASSLREATQEFRDRPWRYGNKALICDPYYGIYKFAETEEELGGYLEWVKKYNTTRMGRSIRVAESFTSEYGSNPGLDNFIRTMKFTNESAIHITASGLYIPG